MGTLRMDSPICRRIVLAFLDFIQSVEPAPGVDLEGLDVVKECLEETFKLNEASAEYRTVPPGLLVNLFSSVDRPNGVNSESVSGTAPTNASNIRSIPSAADPSIPGSSKSGEQLGGPLDEGMSRDELFVQFYAALDKINFFMATPGGDEDHAQVAKATHFFEEALLELEKSGNQIINRTNLAETFKSQGNRDMQLKSYSEAIEQYTCAIALCEKNAIYYCNRAAAYTQISSYTEAITDCKKSIEIDPNYAKAYSRLGLVYYALEKYKEALFVFLKALQLDPNNESVRENIRVAQQKWREQQLTESGHQSTGSSHSQQQNAQTAGSSHHATGFQIPINVSDFANVFMNMASSAGPSHAQQQNSQSAGPGTHSYPSVPVDLSQILGGMVSGALGQQGHARDPNGNAGGSNDPGIRMDTNNINLQELPQELSGILGSVMEMFSSQNGQQDHDSSSTG